MSGDARYLDQNGLSHFTNELLKRIPESGNGSENFGNDSEEYLRNAPICSIVQSFRDLETETDGAWVVTNGRNLSITSYPKVFEAGFPFGIMTINRGPRHGIDNTSIVQFGIYSTSSDSRSYFIFRQYNQLDRIHVYPLEQLPGKPYDDRVYTFPGTSYSPRFCGITADRMYVQTYSHASGSLCHSILYSVSPNAPGSSAQIILEEDKLLEIVVSNSIMLNENVCCGYAKKYSNIDAEEADKIPDNELVEIGVATYLENNMLFQPVFKVYSVQKLVTFGDICYVRCRSDSASPVFQVRAVNLKTAEEISITSKDAQLFRDFLLSADYIIPWINVEASKMMVVTRTKERGDKYDRVDVYLFDAGDFRDTIKLIKTCVIKADSRVPYIEANNNVFDFEGDMTYCEIGGISFFVSVGVFKKGKYDWYAASAVPLDGKEHHATWNISFFAQSNSDTKYNSTTLLKYPKILRSNFVLIFSNGYYSMYYMTPIPESAPSSVYTPTFSTNSTRYTNNYYSEDMIIPMYYVKVKDMP